MFVFCEGRTEETILHDLRTHWRISKRLVEIAQEGDPWNIVEMAARRRRQDRQAEIWVVFDRDTHERWSDAVDRALKLDLRLGITNPCFELWALLLHVDHQAPLGHHEAQRALRRHHPGYHHERHPYLDLACVLAGLEVADRRSALLVRRADDDGAPFKCPTTRFHELVQALRRRAAEP